MPLPLRKTAVRKRDESDVLQNCSSKLGMVGLAAFLSRTLWPTPGEGWGKVQETVPSSA